MTVVGQAQNGIEAIKLVLQTQSDVTLLDLRMPEMDGVEAITAICAEFATARIIVLTRQPLSLCDEGLPPHKITIINLRLIETSNLRLNETYTSSSPDH